MRQADDPKNETKVDSVRSVMDEVDDIVYVESSNITFKFFQLPKDNQQHSFEFLATKDLANTAAVNAEFRKLTFDATSEEAKQYQALVKGQKILNGKKSLHHSPINNVYGLIALGEGLITTLQEEKMHDDNLITLFVSNGRHGLIALQKGYIKSQDIIDEFQLHGHPVYGEFQAFMSEGGIIHDLVTTNEKMRSNDYHDVLRVRKALSTESGQIALRDNLITLNQAKKCYVHHLESLMAPNGITALQERLNEGLERARSARNIDVECVDADSLIFNPSVPTIRASQASPALFSNQHRQGVVNTAPVTPTVFEEETVFVV